MAYATTSPTAAASPLLMAVNGSRVHPPKSAAGLHRREERAKLAALFGFDADTRTWNPDQVKFGQEHGFLPTGPAKPPRQTPQALVAHNPPPSRQAGQALSMLMSQVLNPPATRNPGTGQRGAAATAEALRMLGVV